MIEDIRADIKKVSSEEKAELSKRFFKTGKGEYAEGDMMLGITVPQARVIAKKYTDLPIQDIESLLTSPFHEERLIALFILVNTFKTSGEKDQKEIYDFYLKHTKYINNWDLVDSSADKIVGEYLVGKSKEILPKLARSKLLWERRIAMIATYAFIKRGSPLEALKIAEILLYDSHDLIQKAVGWMLREVGKRCGQEAEESFLKKYYKTMPRTTLRYAIERLPDEKRKEYLRGILAS